MSIEFRVLDISEIDHILNFETARLSGNSEEDMLMSWSAPWRRESLEYYLPKGWCFAAWQDHKIVGYFLAQPIIFFRQFTQTLWIEYLAAKDQSIQSQLVDLARRYGRDKHLQAVLFAEQDFLTKELLSQGGNQIADKIIQFNTTKMR